MKRLLISCFGLGRLPIAPGTWGSLPPAALFALLSLLRAPGVSISIVMAVLVLVGSVVCVKFAPELIAATGKTDPGEIVADEFAGQAVTFLAAGFFTTAGASGGRIWAITGLGFVLFRIFDIVKPWPARKLEGLPAGWGVLADDLAAGVYAAIVLQICIILWFAG